MAKDIEKWLREWVQANIVAKGRTAIDYAKVIDDLLLAAQDAGIAENDLDKVANGDVRSHIRLIMGVKENDVLKS